MVLVVVAIMSVQITRILATISSVVSVHIILSFLQCNTEIKLFSISSERRGEALLFSGDMMDREVGLTSCLCDKVA